MHLRALASKQGNPRGEKIISVTNAIQKPNRIWVRTGKPSTVSVCENGLECKNIDPSQRCNSKPSVNLGDESNTNLTIYKMNKNMGKYGEILIVKQLECIYFGSIDVNLVFQTKEFQRKK